MKRFYLNILIFLFLILLTSCNKPSYQFYRYEYNGYLDTIGYIIVEYDANKYTTIELEDIFKKTEELMVNVEKEFSINKTIHMEMLNIEKSTLMIINERSGQNVPTKVSDDFLKMLDLADKMYKYSDGLFDVTIGSLTKLWQISEKSEYCMDDLSSMEYLCKIPSQEDIDKNKELIKFQDVSIDYEEKTVSLNKKGMALDFGAIGKGYAVEKLANYLSEFDFPYKIINIGGNVKNIGTPNSDTTPLKIYVQNPFGVGNIGYYHPKINTGGVTSGIYERYIHYQGVKYHHILNPKTGYPCSEEIVSVTISGEDSGMADALSTCVFMLGVEAGIDLINSLEGYDAIIITKDEKVYVSNKIDFIQEKIIK